MTPPMINEQDYAATVLALPARRFLQLVERLVGPPDHHGKHHALSWPGRQERDQGGNRRQAHERARSLDFQPWIAPCQRQDRKSTRLNSSHVKSSYAVFCW